MMVATATRQQSQPRRTLGHAGTPHQRRFWRDDARYRLFVGGVGSGKTRAGCVEVLRQPARSVGMVVAPTYPMLRDATLRTFLDLAQRGGVLKSFNKAEMVATLIDGKVILFRSADAPDRLRGPNLGWFYLDEAALMEPDVWLIMIGRLRLQPGRAWATSTPRGFNWMHETFIKGDDAYSVIRASTRSNPYLPADFIRSLESAYDSEWAAQELEGEFIDTNSIDRFLPSIIWWDACRRDLAPLNHWLREPLLLAVDAGVTSDTFALVAVGRHPTQPDGVAVRMVRVWVPQGGKPLDFDPIEDEIRAICRQFNVLQIAYDPYQLHQMMSRLNAQGVAWCEPFNQGPERLLADKTLLDLIMQQRVAHDGNAELRAHIENADRKVGEERGQLRLVKRSPALKIDLAVALSMAAYRMLQQPQPANLDSFKALSSGSPV